MLVHGDKIGIRRGIMLIISAPSGVGKTSLIKKLIQQDQKLTLSVSATTRPARSGEIDGIDYDFISLSSFEEMIRNDSLLEYVQSFGHWYGTPKERVKNCIDQGIDIIFDVNWRGAHSLVSRASQDVVSVFLLPPSMKELYRRLQERNTESQDVIDKRFQKSFEEISRWMDYDYVFVNQDLDQVVSSVSSIIEAERLKRFRQFWISGYVDGLYQDDGVL